MIDKIRYTTSNPASPHEIEAQLETILGQYSITLTVLQELQSKLHDSKNMSYGSTNNIDFHNKFPQKFGITQQYIEEFQVNIDKQNILWRFGAATRYIETIILVAAGKSASIYYAGQEYCKSYLYL